MAASDKVWNPLDSQSEPIMQSFSPTL
jgi:virulence factor